MASKKNEASAPTTQETREQEASVEEAMAAEEVQPTEFYEVQVNRALQTTDRVSIAGKMFYYDNTRNREEGTWVVDNVQWESIKGIKDPEANVSYIVRKSTISSEGGE